MLLSEFIRNVTEEFKKIGIPTPLLDAQLLISHVLGIEKHELNLRSGALLDERQLKDIRKLVTRRLAFEPVAYIIKNREFYSLPFFVNRDVLIPRPETELVVDMVIYYARQNGRVLDLGTGSGAIAVAVKYNRPDLNVCASDISDRALRVAKKNSNSIIGKGAISFFCGHLFEPFPGERFDVIASNPPYVNSDISDTLQKELSFEPPLAIFTGDKGRSLIKKIVDEGGEYLSDKGILILEIGFDMKDYVLSAAEKGGYRASVMNDYAGLPRLAVLKT